MDKDGNELNNLSTPNLETIEYKMCSCGCDQFYVRIDDNVGTLECVNCNEVLIACPDEIDCLDTII